MCNDGDVRLMNSSVHTSNIGIGRVEICYNNSYWVICDDRWDIFDAGVVCRQLGEQSSSEVHEPVIQTSVVLCLCSSQLQFLFVEVCMVQGQCPSFLMTLCALVTSRTSSSASTVGLGCTTVTHLKQLG